MKQIFFYFLLAAMFSFFISCAKNDNLLPVPKIDYGMAVLQGKISRNIPDSLKIKSFEIVYFTAICSEPVFDEILVNADGTFSYSVDLYAITIASVKSSIYSNSIVLIPNDTSEINILYDDKGEKHITMKNSLGLTSENMDKWYKVFVNLIYSDAVKYQDSITNTFTNAPDIFAKKIIENINNVIDTMSDNRNLNKTEKILFEYCAKSMYLCNVLLESDFLHKHFSFNDKNSSAYFAELKKIDLSNAYYIYSGWYGKMAQMLLEDSILNFPKIAETTPEQWLKNSNEKILMFLQNRNTLFDNMLVANAYYLQLKKRQLLTQIQKQNIKSYFENKNYVQFLNNENNTLEELLQKDTNYLKINETPPVDKTKLMDAIIVKYTGNVVVVDFWATWCAPCQRAMQLIEDIKKDYANKNVKFVYITNPSSPKDQWEMKIRGIGGEQYFLNTIQYNYISALYEFDAIPTYLIFDKKGKLSQKFTGYPGNETMQEVIEKAMK